MISTGSIPLLYIYVEQDQAKSTSRENQFWDADSRNNGAVIGYTEA